jgi:hypothetical protein
MGGRFARTLKPSNRETSMACVPQRFMGRSCSGCIATESWSESNPPHITPPQSPGSCTHHTLARPLAGKPRRRHRQASACTGASSQRMRCSTRAQTRAQLQYNCAAASHNSRNACGKTNRVVQAGERRARTFTLILLTAPLSWSTAGRRRPSSVRAPPVALHSPHTTTPCPSPPPFLDSTINCSHSTPPTSATTRAAPPSTIYIAATSPIPPKRHPVLYCYAAMLVHNYTAILLYYDTTITMQLYIYDYTTTLLY